MMTGGPARPDVDAPWLSGPITRFLWLLLLTAVASCLAPTPAGATAPSDVARSVSVAEIRENDENGVPLLVGQIVTLSGVAVIDTGSWHNAANYFALVSHGDTEASRAGVLVYLPGSIQPPVRRGQMVRVTGELGIKGYSTDFGSTVIMPRGPEEILPLADPPPSSDLTATLRILEAEPPRIPTDAMYDEVERYEGTPVTIAGRLSRYDNETTTRGFWVDGSRDGEIEDGRGAMNVKFYDYAGIEIGAFGNGDYVRVTGILVQGDEAPPYTDFYYLRPTRQEDLVRVPEKSLPREEEPPAPETMSFQNGPVQRVASYGLYRLTSLTSGTDFPFLGTFHPAWHPDGSMIALSLSKEQNRRTTQEPAHASLFLMRFTDRAEILPLTFDATEKQEPAWSPDGRRLVYAGASSLDEPGGNWDLFVLEGLNGAGGRIRPEAARRLTETKANERSPVWAPDGRHIAFRSDAGGNWDLCVMDTATGQITQVTSHPGADAFPTWSPNGTHLSFQSDRSRGRWTIWTVPVRYGADGSISGVGEARMLVPAGPEGASYVEPAWSPSGDQIAFVSNAGGDWDIWVAPVVWSDAEPWAAEPLPVRMPGPSAEKHPAWDPTGDRVAFVSDQGGSWNLWAASLPGALSSPEAAGSGGEELPRAETAGQPMLPAAYPPPEAFELPSLLSSLRRDGGMKLLWPRLASPAVITGGDRLTVLVAIPDGGSPDGWQGRFVCSRGGEEGGQASKTLTPVGAVELSASGNGWAPAATGAGTGIWEITFAAPVGVPGGLYDLTLAHSSGATSCEPHAVQVLADRAPDSFTFALVTDIHLHDRRSRGADPRNPLNAQVTEILGEIEQLKPDFVLMLGDFAQSTADTYHRDYPLFRELVLQHLSVPLYGVMGNHDGQLVGRVNGFAWWVDRIGPLYFSFDYGNWHFVGVNSYDHPASRSASGTVGRQQLLWLGEDLARASAAGRQIAVFMHHNPFDDRWVFFMDDSRRDVVRLLERYGAKAVFVGHRHSDQLDESEITRYVTTRTAQAASPELCGYGVVRVEDGWMQLHPGQ
ncbi:hypothetical protein LIP_0925 [Limnochorda pilosa]|uniref:Calcineurin-like phosphoesterase domain-containing protein n=2 Tax=Limnochorda pilosa TaxID=1555112 RepID=A0A0K2SID9_LIMPI|nr:hypothetical protein LIP_0925 [Limnochorda pilosa]